MLLLEVAPKVCCRNQWKLVTKSRGPQNVTGLTEVVRNPIHSTGVGLLMYGREHQNLGRSNDSDGLGWLSKMKNWFQGNF